MVYLYWDVEWVGLFELGGGVGGEKREFGEGVFIWLEVDVVGDNFFLRLSL